MNSTQTNARREYQAKYHAANREKAKVYQAQYRAANKDKARVYWRNYYSVNRERRLANGRIYYEKNRERIIVRNNEWLRQHPEQSKAYKKKWKKGSTEGALRRRITDSLRARMRKVLRGNGKSASALKLLGCSVESFKIYLESKWESGMTWENYGHSFGKWNIDHVMPCAIFDLRLHEHQARCFHFSNLQPLWFEDNMAKGAKIQ